jgi:hypothetical protein
MSRYRDQLRIWESDYGRSLGWEIEWDGRVVGLLDEPRQEDMFWTSYRVTSTTDDPALSALLLSEDFWKGDGFTRLIFRSRALGLPAENTFPASGGFIGPRRVSMRALHVRSRDPAPWDCLLLKIRTILRGQTPTRSDDS